MTTIVAPRWERIANGVLFAFFTVAGPFIGSAVFVPGSSAHGLLVSIAVVFVAIGVWGLARSPRVAVHLTDDELLIVGFFTTATIPRDAITVVLDDCTVEWTPPDHGDVRGRRSAIWLFRPAYQDDGSPFARFWRWRRDGLLQVRAWAHARAV
ncbi:hypothetical protein ACRQ4B_15990 [Curtobacterium sp. SP.BCo]|uniref:hypothetical protein n=1 Tax=Curtobacterium sp. SP.BCo TaxID=3435229 RepID=UPI003F73BC90